VARARDDKLARAIANRIVEAREAAGFKTRTAFGHALNRDEKTMARYEGGKMVPGAEALIAISEACDVSLDWLMLGREEAPPAFAEWLTTALGRKAVEKHPKIVGMLRTLPLRGWRPTIEVYDSLYVGIRSGVLEEVDGVDELVRSGRESQRET